MAIRLPAILQVFRVDTSDLKRAQTEADRVGGGLGKSIAKGVAVGGAALVGLGAVGVKSAMGVEKGLAEVVTLTGKVGPEAKKQMGVFGAGVREVSDEFGIAQSVLTDGLYQAISAGVPPDNVFDFMKVASKASIAGVTDVDTAIDGITSTLNAFGLDASEAERVSDSMFAAVAGGKTTFEELSGAVATVAPAAAAAGVGFEEIFAGVATLTSAGKSTSEATTMMRAALTAVQKPTEALTEVFQAAGYESGEAALEAVGLSGALDIVNEASGGSSGELQRLLGRVEAVGAAQIIAGTGSEKMAEELERQAGAAGSVDDAYSVMADTTEQMWAVLKTRLMNALTEVGFNLLPVVNRALDNASAAFSWASENASKLRPWLIGIGTAITAFVLPPLLVYIQQQALAGAAAVRSAATQYAASLRVVAGWVLVGAKSLAAAAKVALAWMISVGPIALVIAAVVGLVVVIVKNWERIKTAITKAATAAWNAVVKAFDAVKATVEKVLAAVVGAVTSAWARVTGAIGTAVATVRTTVSDGFTAVRTAVTNALTSLVTLVTGLPGRFVSALSSLGSTLSGVASSAWEAFRTAVTAGITLAVTTVGALPGRVLSALSNLGSLLTDSGKALLRGFVDGIKSMASAPVDAVKGMVSRVRNLLPFSPAKEGPFSGRGWVSYSGAAIAEGLAEGIDGKKRRARRASFALARTTAGGLAAGLNRGMPAVAELPARLALATDSPGAATTRLGDSLQGELRELLAAVNDLGDRPITFTADLGEGVTARYRIERTREGRARAVRLGGR